MSGYSGTPLPRKLGIAEGGTFALVAAPPDAAAVLGALPAGARRVDELARAIFPDRMLWVAWPKRASKVPTDVTEDVVREVALPLGLVDTKVAAIDATWSGLRLVWRRELRDAG